MNPVNLHIADTTDELSHHIADWLVTYSQEVLERRNRFTIALSGGSTPKQLYRLLASDEYKDRIDWNQWHVFWGDERFVPFADERNNAKMAFDELLSHVPVPQNQVHTIPTCVEPGLAVASYQQLLHRYFDRQLYTFDLVLLGLGDNAHTLSLFPGYTDILFDKTTWVKAFHLEEQDMYRITLTSAIVNNAGRVAFLVSGNDKSTAVRHVVAGSYDPTRYPAQLIRPLNDELYWFIDKQAAAGLQYAV
ncbi:MAG: 6-phosphogluconolactonase [Chitinophagaceae bacterium]